MVPLFIGNRLVQQHRQQVPQHQCGIHQHANQDFAAIPACQLRRAFEEGNSVHAMRSVKSRVTGRKVMQYGDRDVIAVVLRIATYSVVTTTISHTLAKQ